MTPDQTYMGDGNEYVLIPHDQMGIKKVLRSVEIFPVSSDMRSLSFWTRDRIACTLGFVFIVCARPPKATSKIKGIDQINLSLKSVYI